MPSPLRFRAAKALIRAWIIRPDWSQSAPLPPETATMSPASLVNPLFACLPEGGLITDRAAHIMGGVIARLYEDDHEAAKNVVRRFMWHMNEESGNIGWGIPEAFGESLAQSPPLCDAFYRVLFSYILNKEGDSTYCDYAPLRSSCYKATAMVLKARPDLLACALTLLQAGAMQDTDAECRSLASSIIDSLSPSVL